MVVCPATTAAPRTEAEGGRPLGFRGGESREGDFEAVRRSVLGELRRTLRPELLGRMDEVIVFRRLERRDVEEIARRIDDQYPYEEEVLAPAKMGVSEIVRGAAQCRFDSRPAFLARTQGLTGAQRGNAVHRFLQFADFSRAAADLPAEIARLAGQGYLTAEERRAVEEAGLERFFASRLFLRMQASPRLERELRFLSIVGGSRLARYGLALPNGGGTVVQGVADCVFLENGRAVIVDFKTDRVQSAQQLAERYTPQLSLYRELLADTLACPMGECILYSTCLGLEIPLTLADQEKIPSSP